MQQQISASFGMSFSDLLRATSKRHGEITFCSTCAPRALSFSTVSSVDPVSSTQMSSASDIESMKRSTNCDSFLQMA